MAVSQKVEERGWFYHAPAKKQQIVFDDLPPASQIPGLSDLPEFEQEPLPTKKWIRETDSKYVRICKKGGRPDLMRWRSPKPRADKAVDYPRPDWFYHDDVTDEEQQQQNKDFHLPEYMVHEEYKPDGDVESTRPNRLPYAYDRLSIYEREPGNRPTDKKVKIPERQMPGQLRLNKQQQKYKNVVVKKPHAGLKMQDNLKSSNPRYQAMPEMYENNDKPHMGKIMSYNYGNEWRNALDDWQTTQDRTHSKIVVKPKEKIQSEYQEQCSKLMQTKTKKTTDKKISPRREKKTELETEKPLFKLTRFTKVAARTDSHWVPETQAHQSTKAHTKVHTYNQQIEATNNMMVPVSH